MSNVDRVREYVRRQYETDEGTVEENVAGLFAEDLIYHLGDKTVGREAQVEAVTMIRGTPTENRTVAVSDFREEGDTVTFHVFIEIRGNNDGEDLVMETDSTYVFNAEGKVAEAFPSRVEEVEGAFRAAGVDPVA